MNLNSQNRKAFILFCILGGCTPLAPSLIPPPALNPSLLEGQTMITGSGVSNGIVKISIDGKAVAQGIIFEKGNFGVDVPVLILGQVITATQTIKGETSPSSHPIIVQRAPLIQITISPLTPITIEQGQIQRFSAKGAFANGRKVDPLSNVRWKSTNSVVATITPNGVTTGKEPGKTTIQASRDGVRSSPISLTVKPHPPTILSSLKAGDSIIEGKATSFSTIQVSVNGTPRGNPVVADSTNQWKASMSPPLNQNDHVTSTQTVNGIESDASPRLTTGENNPPTFSPIGNQRLLVGETLTISLAAQDPDGDELKFEVTPLPTNGSLDAETGRFTFTPEVDQMGETTLTFRATDGNLVDEKTVSISVLLPDNLVILLQNPDGTVGTIHVSSAGKTKILNQAGHTIRLTRTNTPLTDPFIIDDKEIREIFQEALITEPEEPLKFVLYFITDTTELSPESQQQLPQILSIIKDRPVHDISVIGHTDRTATDEYNHQLSLERASTIRNAIVSGGIEPHVVEVTGHGENDPLVKTADDVKEPLNRRVEIIVR